MKSNNVKKIVLLILFILLVIATIYLFNKGLVVFYIVSFVFSIVIFVVLITSITLNKSPDELYERDINNILKVYDAILVQCSNYPKLSNRNLIKIDSIEDIVDAQLEIRKPIYCIKQNDFCCFIILDTTEALVFIKKRNDDVKCPLDIELENYEIKREKDTLNKINGVDNILDDIDKTTILKLSNDKRFRIHPLSKEEEQKNERQQFINNLRNQVKENINNLDLEQEQRKFEEASALINDLKVEQNTETI